MVDRIIHDGLVAMQHFNSNPCTVKIQEDNSTYSFVPKHNISMALIKPEHVDALLRKRAKMCCGKKQAKFYLSSQINLNLWLTGNRHGTIGEE